MRNTLLLLERSFFEHRCCSDRAWLDAHLHDGFLECGRSGLLWNKAATIEALLGYSSNRNIIIYNFRCEQIHESVWLAHYVTKEEPEKAYFRTSIWIKEGPTFKMRFHQASPLSGPHPLIAEP